MTKAIFNRPLKEGDEVCLERQWISVPKDSIIQYEFYHDDGTITSYEIKLTESLCARPEDLEIKGMVVKKL